MPTSLIFSFLTVIFAFFYKNSKFGLLLRASRDNDIAAESIGANIIYLRWFAIIASAFLAGIAGGLWGHFITSFSPKSFYLKETFLVISMIIIGGSFTVTGAIAGALLVTIGYEFLRWTEKVIKFSDAIKFEFIGIKCLGFFANDSEIICCTHNNLGSFSFVESKFIISILQSNIFDKLLIKLIRE